MIHTGESNYRLGGGVTDEIATRSRSESMREKENESARIDRKHSTRREAVALLPIRACTNGSKSRRVFIARVCRVFCAPYILRRILRLSFAQATCIDVKVFRKFARIHRVLAALRYIKSLSVLARRRDTRARNFRRTCVCSKRIHTCVCLQDLNIPASPYGTG